MGAEREGGEEKGRKEEKETIREKDHGVGGQVDDWEEQERGEEAGGKQPERGGWVGKDLHTPAGKKDRSGAQASPG